MNDEKYLEYDKEKDYQELIEDVKRYILSNGEICTSEVQRKFRLGYSKSAIMLDELEQSGFIKRKENSRMFILANR
ncbi:MAG: DNA translocase FtsK [Christensenellales bacterium]